MLHYLVNHADTLDHNQNMHQLYMSVIDKCVHEIGVIPLEEGIECDIKVVLASTIAYKYNTLPSCCL